MQIIPAINCFEFSCVAERLTKAAGFSAEWVHFDVADGIFAPIMTWNDPHRLFELNLSKISAEVHFMVDDPSGYFVEWAGSLVKRVWVHVEVLNQNADFFVRGAGGQCEFGLAICAETAVEKAVPFLDGTRARARFAQVLAVRPGLSGQKFQPQALGHIKFLRERFPSLMIEIDGGVNEEIARLAKSAGADIAVSSSYIWGNENPEAAWRTLGAV